MLDGPATDHALSDSRATILRWLRRNSPATPKTIAEATGIAYDTAKKTCQRMLTDHQLAADTTGRYAIPGDQGEQHRSVPAVPAVPRSASSSTNSADHGGQPEGSLIDYTLGGDAPERIKP
jgi:hypothetical protein